MSMPIWVLVDATNYVHRYFHAMGSDCDAAAATMIKGLRKGLKAKRVVACFDSSPSFRVGIDPRYKATRGPKPDGIPLAIEALKTRLAKANIEIVECASFEADDCIATLARIAVEVGRRVVVASPDKDLKQCLKASLVTQLVDAKRDGNSLRCRWYTASDLWDDYGVLPSQWPDFQALVGDKSDNILGADGIGEVAAKNILQACETVEGYYANIWAAKGLTNRQMLSMREFWPRYRNVRKLVTLRADVPLPAKWMEAA